MIVPLAIAALLLAPSADRRRLQADRADAAFDGEHAAAKQSLLDAINVDRQKVGVPPLKVDALATHVGEAFCTELLETALSHYDQAGAAPYERWVDAGGIDYHGENVSAYASGTAAILDRPLREILGDLHRAMMAETPPNDGHRRALLDRNFTHVGVGVAVARGRVRLCEEFTSDALDWAEVPAGLVSGGDTDVR